MEQLREFSGLARSSLRWILIAAAGFGLLFGHFMLVRAAWGQLLAREFALEAALTPVLLWYDVLVTMICRVVMRRGASTRLLVVASLPAAFFGVAGLWSVMQPTPAVV